MTRKLLIAPSTASRAAARTRPALKPLSLALLSVALSAQAAQPLPSTALPSGLQVINGQASLSTQGTQLTVRNSANSILNWQSFSIGRDASVYFDQASSSSKVLNRVLGNDPSQILGRLASNGQVWLLNPNGVLFGRDARVDVSSLVTSTLRLNDSDFLAGRYRFSAQAGDGGLVRNEGVLKSSLGGQVVLLGSRIENVGSVEAERGQVNLAAVQSVELVDTGAPNLSVRVDVPAGEVLNLGQLAAAGGQIDVHAASVNQQGIVRADTLSTDAQGRIVLSASQTLNLGASSQTSADGSRGGAITLDANAGTALIEGQVTARGQGGQGGQLLLQGRQIGLLDGSLLDASGRDGGGRILVGGGAQGQDRTLRNAESVFMGQQARIQADAGLQGNGGNIVLWSDKATRAYGHFSAHGGSQGGQGGFLETSGGWLDARPASLDLAAPKGQAGNWLLDPNDITIRDTGTDTNISSGPNFSSTGDSSVITTATIAAALNAGNSVTVSTAAAGANSQAGDIDASMTLSVTPTAPVSLTLKAGRDIWLHDSNISASGNALSLSLQAAGSGKGAVVMSDTTYNSQGGNLFMGGQNNIQLPTNGGQTAQAYPASVDFTPTASDLPRIGNSAVFGGSANTLLNARVDLGAGKFQAFGLAPFGGLDIMSSTLHARSMEVVGAATNARSVSVVHDSAIALSDSLNVTLYSGIWDVKPRVGTGSTIKVGTTQSPGSAVNVSVHDSGGTAIQVQAGSGQTAPVLDFHANSIDIAATSVSTRTTDSGISITGVAGNPTVDFSGSTSVSLSGGIAGTGDAIKLSNATVIGPTASNATTTLTGSSSAGTGKVLLQNSSFTGAGQLAMFGQAVWLMTSQVTNSALPLSITSSTSGSSILGTFVTGSTLRSGGGLIGLGNGTVGHDSVATINIYNSQLDAGAGTVRLRGYNDTARGVMLWGGTSVLTNSFIGEGKSTAAATGFETQQGASLQAADLNIIGETSAGAPFRGVSLTGPTSIKLTGQGTAAFSGSVILTNGLNLTGTAKQVSFTASGSLTLQDTTLSNSSGDVSLAGTASAVGGKGVELDGTLVAASKVQIVGKGTANLSSAVDAFGIYATSSAGTPTRIQAGSIDLQGNSDARAAATNRAGVYLLSNTDIQLTGRGASTINGDSVLFEDVKVSGNAASLNISSADTQRFRRSNFDFSAGPGTAMSFFGDANGDQLGSMILDRTTIKTGGGDFKARGVGLHIGGFNGDPSPSRAINIGAAISLRDSSVDAGLGNIDLWGSGGWGILVNTSTVGVNGISTLQADTIKLYGERHPDCATGLACYGIQVSVNTTGGSPQIALNLKARDIAITGVGDAWNSALGASIPAIDANSNSTWEASNSLTINGGKGGINLQGVTLKGQSVEVSSAEQLAITQVLLAASSSVKLNALGGTDPAQAFGIRFNNASQITGDTISIHGAGRGANGIAFRGNGGQITANQTLSVQGEDSQLQKDGLSFMSPWLLRGFTSLSLASKHGVEFDAASGLPSLWSAKLVDLQFTGLPASATAEFDGPLFSAMLSNLPATALAKITVQGAPMQLVGALQLPSRIQLATDDLSVDATGRIASDASGDAVVLSGSDGSGGMKSFTNLAGASALSTPNGRWVALLSDPTAEQLGGLVPDFRLYGLGLQSLPLDANGNRITPKPGSFIGYSVSLDTGGNEATRGAQSTLDSALLQVTTPVIMSTPSQSRVLDSLPGLGFDASNGNNLSFKTLNVSQMSRSELVTLLAARDNYKKKLFSDVLYKLQLDPSLADVRPCTNEAELSTGQCLITESLKQQILAARKLEQLRRDKSRKVKQATLAAIERKVALLIGINQYADKRIPELVSAVPDATAIRDLLEDKLGYETVLVENASKETIVRALNKLALESNPNDSVMIYYAGHGEVVPKTGMGYWLPSDSRVDRAESWLSNADIARLVSLIGAKQMMLVSDSCYSGTLAGSERISVDGKTEATDMLSRKAAVIMSSGGNEPVSDEGRDGHSVFAWHLMNKLGELSGWQAGGNVFERIRAAVSAEFPQTPQYGANKLAGHQGNTDYLFERREIEKNEQ